jgi:putative transcriptional regulator
MMRENIQEAVASTLGDMIAADLPVSFTEKELDRLGVSVPSVSLSADAIRRVRRSLGVSQAVFAKMLNVSLSSVRQWEQNLRTPTGSTMVLLELLQRDSGLLDYRLERRMENVQ